MWRNVAGRANIKLICRSGTFASETLSALQKVHSVTALKKSAVYDWFSLFKNGQMTFEDDRSGRPSICRTEEIIEKLRQLIPCDRRMSLVELEQEVGISHGSSHAIMTEDL